MLDFSCGERLYKSCCPSFALLGIVVLYFGLGCDLSSVWWRFVICGMVVCDTPLLVSPWHSFVCALVSVSLSGVFHR